MNDVKFTIECTEGCSIKDRNIVFGNEIYSDTTGICIGASHSGVIGSDGGRFLLEIKQGLNGYKSVKANGVDSEKLEKSTEFALVYININKLVFEPFIG